MMVATRKRNRPQRKIRLPHVEQLEDRRVFNVGWQPQVAPVTIQFTEVVVVVQWLPAPAPAQAAPALDFPGLGPSASAWAHEEIHGLDLTRLIHQLQSKDGDDQGGQQGDGGETGNGDSGSTGGSTSGSPGGPVSTGGTGTGSSHGSSGNDGGSRQGTGGTTTQGPTSTPSQGDSSTPTQGGSTAQPVAATPASAPPAQDNLAKAPEASPTATTTPGTSIQVVSMAPAALAVEAAGAGAVAGPPVAIHPDAVTRADQHPAVTAVVPNAPSSSSFAAVRIDFLPGGTEQPALPPRGRTGGGPVEQGQPTEPNAMPPAEAAPAVRAKARPDGAGVEEKTDTAAEPQEAGLLTKVPAAAVAPLGLQQALHRLKDLLADLTTSRALLHALPLTGAALALGGAVFGLVRWRKKRRTAKGLPEAAPDEEERETWLPGSGSMPPVDPS
jgi:hypothetical protein